MFAMCVRACVVRDWNATLSKHEWNFVTGVIATVPSSLLLRAGAVGEEVRPVSVFRPSV